MPRANADPCMTDPNPQKIKNTLKLAYHFLTSSEIAKTTVRKNVGIWAKAINVATFFPRVVLEVDFFKCLGYSVPFFCSVLFKEIFLGFFQGFSRILL